MTMPGHAHNADLVPQSSRPPAPRPLILNVDDTDFSRRTVTQILEQAGLDVLEAVTGEEALRLAERQPDLILLDVELPDIRGLEVVRRLKARERTTRIPVVHLSATRVTSEDCARGLNVGADGYLVHPVDPEVLIATIHAMLRMRRVVDRVSRMQELSAALSRSTTAPAVASAVIQYGIAATYANDGAVAVIDGEDGLDILAATTRWPSIMRADSGRLSLHTPLPLTVCAWTGESLWIATPEELRTSYPMLCECDDAPQAIACVPLLEQGRVIGAVGFSFDEPTPFNEVARATLLTIADQCSQALERARLHDERNRLEDALRASVRARDDMLAIVSHDLRNPLGVITIGAAMLARAAQTHPDGDKLSRYVERIQSAARRMDTLMSDLLDAASLEAGRFRIDRAPHQAQAIVGEAVELFGPLAAEKGIRLEQSADDPLLVSCDKRRLIQALSNLLSNAVKFTPPGGTVIVSAAESPGGVAFSVSDTGGGIPSEHVPHLFDRYWKGDDRALGGVGLGLFIVKGITAAHGGEVHVETSAQTGTTFTLRIPRA